MEEPFDPQAGAILLVDKPTTWSSFDVVKKIRGALRILTGQRIKVGHAGTLDPLASGLLVIGVGKSTKLLPTLTDHDKGYTATLKLGAITASYDAETPETDHRPWEHVTEAEVRAALDRFTGSFQQRPPNFSAKRFQGERAYFLARDGAHVELALHDVRIERIDLLGIEGPEVRIDVACSKGTYIRSLAHDVGQVLGCGAYLVALRRTRSGPYTLEGARTPEEWSVWLDAWILRQTAGDQQVR